MEMLLQTAGWYKVNFVDTETRKVSTEESANPRLLTLLLKNSKPSTWGTMAGF